MSDVILSIKDLSVTFGKKGTKPAVEKVSYELKRGEVLGVVGESGSGKSVSSLAIMDLLPNTSKVEAKELMLDGKNLLAMSHRERRGLLGNTIAMIFQDALNSLDPVYTIGDQMIEVLRLYEPGKNEQEYFKQAVDLLNQVGIKQPELRMKAYPHELSGGMLQRIGIAMAISAKPKVLIADEPTTALDVLIQNQIIDLLMEIKERHNMSLIFISHNLALVSQIVDRIVVMQSGQVVETGAVKDIFLHPKQPYTINLIKSLPQFARHLSSIDLD